MTDLFPPPRIWLPQVPPPPPGWLDFASAGARGLANTDYSMPVVWAARLSDAESFLPGLAVDLSPAERRRAERYHQAEDRARSILARALVRRLLGAHLGLEPSALDIVLGPRGKPRLAPSDEHPSPPCFNLSHSGDLVLAAFHSVRAVGVDVERIRDDFDLAEISAQTFSPEVHAAWLGFPIEERAVAFYRAWTRHEAVLKASGHGLVGGSAGHDSPPVAWHELEVPPGYAAHVAIMRA